MSCPDGAWLGGAALLPFPVPSAVPLAGYAARTGPAVGVLDELAIATLLLTRGSDRLAIVAADVVGADAELADEVAQAAGLARSELALCATHTHSGPAGITARLHPADPDVLDRQLRTRFVATAAATLALARERLEPVELILGSARAGDVAANRNDPMGPYDDRLTILAARRPDGSFQAVLVHFACHPTILGAENRLVSADFPGVLRQEITAALAGHGKAPVVLFVNGAAGDVSTRFTRHGQDVAEVERIGKRLAMAAGNALAAANPLWGSLRHGSATVRLPLRRDRASRADRAVSAPSVPEPGATDLSPARERIAVTRAQGEAMLAALTAIPHELAAIPRTLRIDAWTLGDLALVAVPAELFVSLGREIEKAFPGTTLILGYANGYSGYLADRTAHRSGTYEALASPFGPEAGERVAATAARLVARLRSGPHGPGVSALHGILDRS
jgi:hypothetical protein